MGLQQAVNLKIARFLATQLESFIARNARSSSKLTASSSPPGAKENLVKRVPSSALKTTPASNHRSYAGVARIQDAVRLDIRPAKRSKRRGKRSGNRLNGHNNDRRILVAIDALARLNRASLYALQMALCEEVEGLTLADIPSITLTSTSWSIAP